MVATPMHLSARDDFNDGKSGDWGPLQIATPAIVGGVLLLLFAGYIVWQKRKYNGHTFGYRQIGSEFIAKVERMFVPRRKRVVGENGPVTLDDSMRSTWTPFGQRWSRQYLSDTSDAHTPLTAESRPFEFPVNDSSDSPPPNPKRRSVRWWWLFGSRPKEVKPKDPGQQWRVDDADENSSACDHEDQDEDVETLDTLQLDSAETEDGTMMTETNLTSSVSTHFISHPLLERPRPVHEMPTVPEYESSDARTPAPVASTLQNIPAMPAPLAIRGLPQPPDGRKCPPTEDAMREAYAGLYMAIPASVRATGYPLSST